MLSILLVALITLSSGSSTLQTQCATAWAHHATIHAAVRCEAAGDGIAQESMRDRSTGVRKFAAGICYLKAGLSYRRLGNAQHAQLEFMLAQDQLEAAQALSNPPDILMDIHQALFLLRSLAP